MEPSLLQKNHRAPDDGARPAHVRASSISSILRPSPEDEEGEGPYFDLEFSIPGDGDEGGDTASESREDDVINESFRSDDPSDDLFFKGHLSLLFTPSLKPQLPSALLKSATKFRVFMLRFKKSPRSTQLEAPESSLNVRASKRYSDKLRFSGQLSADGPEKSTGGLRIVSKRLRKSRSASAVVAAVRSPPRRRDDSLAEQEDGIQSAIAHCKRSFNAGKVTGFGSDHRVPVINFG